MRVAPKHPPNLSGWGHVRVHGSVDESCGWRCLTFMFAPVSAYTAQVGTLYSKKLIIVSVLDYGRPNISGSIRSIKM
jgi:hypothetical protein